MNGIKMPSTIGAPPKSITQRQSSMETSRTYFPMLATTKMPIFAAVPITPASSGRETPDHTSLIKATPLGHMPPMPMQTRKRMTNSCHGACT